MSSAQTASSDKQQQESNGSNDLHLDHDHMKSPILFEYLPPAACIGYEGSKMYSKNNYGGILIVAANGSVYFTPVTKEMVGTGLLDDASMITKKAASGDISVYNTELPGIGNESNRVLRLEFPTYPETESDTRNEKDKESRQQPSSVPRRYRPPRRICLSPDYSKLLVLDCMQGGILSLLVFEVNMKFRSSSSSSGGSNGSGGSGGRFLELIFENDSFSISDACFTPDSKSIMVLTRRYPDRIMMLNLPSPKERKPATRDGASGTVLCWFEPRPFGPFRIVGPGPRGITGGSLNHSHMAVQSQGSGLSKEVREYVMGLYVDSDVDVEGEGEGDGDNGSFKVVTWGDDGMGEYTVWDIPHVPQTAEGTDTEAKLRWYTKTVMPCSKRYVKEYDEDANGSKMYIVDAKFDPFDENIAFIVQREYIEASLSGSGIGSGNEPRLSTNQNASGGAGLGLQVAKVIDLDRAFQSQSKQSKKKKGKSKGSVGVENHKGKKDKDKSKANSKSTLNENGNGKKGEMEMVEEGYVYPWYRVSKDTDRRKIRDFRWTHTFALGFRPAAAIVIEGTGLFELVDGEYGSPFQDTLDGFPDHVASFCQCGTERRFWMNGNGEARMFAVKTNNGSQGQGGQAEAQKYPEWSEFVRLVQDSGPHAKSVISLRYMSKKLGYYIHSIDDPLPLSRKGNGNAKCNGNGDDECVCLFARDTDGGGEVVYGFHLYRCSYCTKVLLKPLRCGWCGVMVYCDRVCQREAWPSHRKTCERMRPML